ncbi:hypothetical protein D9M69_663040 [compost metagenome]
MAGAHVDTRLFGFPRQLAAVGGAEIDPSEFKHAEGRMAAVARGAAECRFPVEEHDAFRALSAELDGRGDPGRSAADDEDIRIEGAHCSPSVSTASGVASLPLVISASRALQ